MWRFSSFLRFLFLNKENVKIAPINGETDQCNSLHLRASIVLWGLQVMTTQTQQYMATEKLVLNKDSVPYISMLGEKSVAGRIAAFLCREV